MGRSAESFAKSSKILDSYSTVLTQKGKEINRLGMINSKRKARVEEIKRQIAIMKHKVDDIAKNESLAFVFFLTIFMRKKKNNVKNRSNRKCDKTTETE